MAVIDTVSGRVYVSTVFVRLSVCPTHRPLHAAVVGLLLWAQQAEDIDWSRQPPGDAAAWCVSSVMLTAAVRSRTDLLNINNNLTYNMYCVKKYQVIYNIQLLAMDSTNTYTGCTSTSVSIQCKQPFRSQSKLWQLTEIQQACKDQNHTQFS